MYFSIITPVYNVEKFVRRGVENILGQSFDDFELILVDDGSTDRSGEICDSLSNLSSKIKVIHKPNGGPGPARNVGIDVASGKYVMFFDVDDLMVTDCMLKIHANLADTEAEVLVFGYNEINLRFKSRNSYTFHAAAYKSNSELRDDWAQTLSGIKFNNGFVWNKVYEREFLLRNNIRFEPLAIQQDEVFNLSVYPKVETLTVLDETLYDYFVYDSGNNRSRFIPERIDIFRRVRDAFFGLCDKWGIENADVEAYICKRFLKGVIYSIGYDLYRLGNSLDSKEKAEALQRVLNADDVQDTLRRLRALDCGPSDFIRSQYFKAMEKKSVSRYLTVMYLDAKIENIKNVIRKLR